MIPTNLATIDAILADIDCATEASATNFAIVCVQHLLPTTATLLQQLRAFVRSPHDIYLCGKPYSTCDDVQDYLIRHDFSVTTSDRGLEYGKYLAHTKECIQAMWRDVLRTHQVDPYDGFIILDDGGRNYEVFCDLDVHIKSIPFVVIEQTSAGIRLIEEMQNKAPVINLSGCAVKRVFEPSIIVNELLAALSDLLGNSRGKSIGVVGCGHIGRALVKNLISHPLNICVFDSNPENLMFDESVYECETLEECIMRSDILIGCTGKDICRDINIESVIKSDKLFISCSSEDIEFQSLLNRFSSHASRKRNPLAEINISINKATVTLVRGGYPVNFNNQFEHSSPNEIALTRGLLFAAVLQAMTLITSEKNLLANELIMLAPFLQRVVLSSWLQSNDKHISASELNESYPIEWFQNHSIGKELNYTYKLNEQDAEMLSD